MKPDELLIVSVAWGQSPTEGVFLFSFQKIMKRLIKRYVLKAQVDRENDEVNEGKWNFITDPPKECELLLLLIWPVGGLSLVRMLCRESLAHAHTQVSSADSEPPLCPWNSRSLLVLSRTRIPQDLHPALLTPAALALLPLPPPGHCQHPTLPCCLGEAFSDCPAQACPKDPVLSGIQIHIAVVACGVCVQMEKNLYHLLTTLLQIPYVGGDQIVEREQI